jgi:voltage-gated sodium channel
LSLEAIAARADHAGPAAFCRRLVGQPRFQTLVLVLIVANAALMGIETVPALWQAHGSLLQVLNGALQALFVAEILLRLGAFGARPLGFFRDGWNCFDFAVVALSLLPDSGAFATVARLFRVLRAARLVSALPELRLIVGTMLRSIPSLGHVSLLLGLLLYVYGILGFHLFGAHDPEHWGSLGRSLMTLFQMLTLEGWVEIQARSLAAVPAAWLFYGSFVVVAVFVVINLFIAVVLNNLEAARREEAQRDAQGDARRRIAELRAGLDALERSLG